MAVQAFPYLILTDGVDTVTFADGVGGVTNWPLVRGQWAPSITGLRTSPLAGRGPYADVAEDLSCNIRNTTGALVYSNLDTLARLLDKAERWWLRNEAISPVILKYAPQGSTIHSIATPMQAIVLGRVGTDELNGVDLPQSLNDAGMIFEIRGIKVACLRRGYWTGTSDTVTSGSSGQATPLLITWPATHPVNSPITLRWLGFGSTTTPIIQAGYVCVGSSASDIQVVEAEGGASGVFTSVADAANNARGGNVLRYTPGGTTAVNSGNITIPTTINGPVAIIAALRNNSATTTWNVNATVGGFGFLATTPTYTVDTSSAQPRLVLLGTVNAVGGAATYLTVQASAASGSLDIDYLIVVNLRDETVAVLAFDACNLLAAFGGGASIEMDFIYSPIVDQNPKMRAQNAAGSVSTPMNYRGPLPLLTTGVSLYSLWASTNGASWQFTTAAAAVLAPTPQAIRYRSYLSPQ